jgi:hypothetical protein
MPGGNVMSEITDRIISYVEAANRKDTLEVDVGTVVNAIRTGYEYDLRERTGKIRKLIQVELGEHGDLKKAKLAASELKKHLPAVMWSGTFSERANGKLVQHSGLICADLDSLGAELPRVRGLLQTSAYLGLLFVSPSGDGLKAVFDVPEDAAKHAGSFRAIEKHVMELTGVQIDQACKDLARLCFLAHDPDIYLNNET